MERLVMCECTPTDSACTSCCCAARASCATGIMISASCILCLTSGRIRDWCHIRRSCSRSSDCTRRRSRCIVKGLVMSICRSANRAGASCSSTTSCAIVWTGIVYNTAVIDSRWSSSGRNTWRGRGRNVHRFNRLVAHIFFILVGTCCDK